MLKAIRKKGESSMYNTSVRKRIDNSMSKSIPLNSKKGLIISRVLSYSILIIIVIMCLFPFYLLVVNSTREHSEIQRGFSLWFGRNFLINMKAVTGNTNMPVFRALFNSFYISALTALLATYFSTLTAYAIHVYNFRLKKIAYIFILLIMMIPSQVSSIGFLKMMYQIELVDTPLPLFLPAIASPIVVFFIKQYMESTLQIDMIEAARIDGSNEVRTLHRIIFPILMPAIAVQLIFTFVGAWNNFYMPAMILQTQNKLTIPIIIAQLRSVGNPEAFNMGTVYMLLFMAIFPVLILYLILSRFIISGVTLGSVKG